MSYLLNDCVAAAGENIKRSVPVEVHPQDPPLCSEVGVCGLGPVAEPSQCCEGHD